MLIDELPDWIDPEAWEGFVQMRKTIKKPLTDRAKKLALKELVKLRMEGQDPNEVLDQSTLKCWSGLFAVKGKAATPQANTAINSWLAKGKYHAGH